MKRRVYTFMLAERYLDPTGTENQLSSLYPFNPERGNLFVKVNSFLRVGKYYSMGEEKYLSREGISLARISITYHYHGQL
jgi:hypothetical protein